MVNVVNDKIIYVQGSKAYIPSNAEVLVSLGESEGSENAVTSCESNGTENAIISCESDSAENTSTSCENDGSENPEERESEVISSDVYIIKGKNKTWIYDVGATEEAYREIKSIETDKNIIISHFHRDHIANLSRLIDDNPQLADGLYISKQTNKYSKCGNIVENDLVIEDGLKFKIFPIPSAHAKGCLGLQVGNEYAFVGDAIYPTYRDNKKVYNIQLLKEQIEMLKKLDADKIFISHDKRPYTRKDVVIRFLESVYAKRTADSNFIYQKLF